ncbi:hypothetical protein [Flagellimonas pacifica]|uniref:Aspartyl protease n=1 Tax=Flagellimonas pacifica TaxID=1247520 RepID=A0A285MTV0_9FLAO|nr:hypothetical protein [Allomuricauda parva]SNZ00558.1 Aspartyl protease [Allomuricauda parva]
MKVIKPLFIVCLLLIISSCSVTKKQNLGTVAPNNFYHKTTFTTAKSVIVLPFKINGVEKNFLFDTGADYNLIQRDSLMGSTGNFSGATNRKMKMGTEITKSMKIGSVDFNNTFGVNADLKGLKEQITNFGGLIGQPIISKANWLINYPNKTIKISNRDLSDSSFYTLNISRKDGAPYTYITIDDIKHKVLIDFGSSSDFNLPKDSKLAEQLLEKGDFTNRQRERYTIGGLQKISEKFGVIPHIKIGNLEFRNIETTINTSSQPRIGIGFFKDYIIYIDNLNRAYKLKKN